MDGQGSSALHKGKEMRTKVMEYSISAFPPSHWSGKVVLTLGTPGLFPSERQVGMQVSVTSLQNNLG